ncbi:DUF2202 domain-containing protein [Candidatus Altiarchaeota archaeon]
MIVLLIVSALTISGCTSQEQVTAPGDARSMGSGDTGSSGRGQAAGRGRQGGGMRPEERHDEDHILSLPKEDVSLDEVEALGMALDDEYKARATYEQVIKDFGEERPFVNIITAEERHIAELMELYEKYGLEPVADKWAGNIGSADSITHACGISVQAEIDNAALYDQLFSKVDNQDITAVFTSLRDASRLKHLPAFERCAARG